MLYIQNAQYSLLIVIGKPAKISHPRNVKNKIMSNTESSRSIRNKKKVNRYKKKASQIDNAEFILLGRRENQRNRRKYTPDDTRRF